jgi:hypothetical protein
MCGTVAPSSTDCEISIFDYRILLGLGSWGGECKHISTDAKRGIPLHNGQPALS